MNNSHKSLLYRSALLLSLPVWFLLVCEDPANAFQIKQPTDGPAATSVQQQAYQVSPIERKPTAPVIAEAGDEGELAISTFKYPKELNVKLFAAEPNVANPVALHVDPNGRVYVCETFRQEYGVEDNRNHSHWMDEELQAQSVQDRVDYILKYEKGAKEKYTARDDRIRLLADTNGDGTADKITVFSDRYNAIADGTGAGVLSVGSDVYYTNIPHLWKLTDTDADGVADVRKSLIKGFGVRFAFRGHDMHGLIVGPDHRLYFSIGDRGYNVSPEIHDATSGAIFSCELDGSDLQVVATGLRNPQELAFDDYGNLFTGDNNSDSGDRARWVYVVPGGDSGWRMYYQYLPDRGPFNRERIWEPYNKDTPAYIVPPIANIADGPSGLAFYPGTGFSDFFKDRFFLCDFRGVANTSGIRSFKLKPKGAGFEITDMDKTFWNTLSTDMEFGPDGKIYVSDWVFGWQGEGKGRVYTYHDPKVIQSGLVKETQSILKSGVGKETEERLVELMGHADRRVRMAAQFELVKRERADVLLDAFANLVDGIELRRLHALWGYERLHSKGLDHAIEDEKGRGSAPGIIVAMASLDAETSEEIRAQEIRFAGSVAPTPSRLKYVTDALKDSSPRVRFMAAMSLGKIGKPQNLQAIANMLVENDDKDPYLRHAGIMGLAGILSRMSTEDLEKLTIVSYFSDSMPTQLALVVALRKLKSPSLVSFLDSPYPRVQLEAARAIHDDLIYSTPEEGVSGRDVFRLVRSNKEIGDCLRALAKLIEGPIKNEQLIRRVLNANMILDEPGRLVPFFAATSTSSNHSFVVHSEVSTELRIEALELLKNWQTPNPRDYVLGDWRPINGKRNITELKALLAQTYQRCTYLAPAVRTKLIEVCTELECPIAPESLARIAKNSTGKESLRIAGLRALARRDEEIHRETISELSGKLDELPDELSTVVIEQLVSQDKQKAIDVLQQVVESDSASVLRKQLSYKTLGEMDDQRSAEILTRSLDRLAKGEIKSSVALDLVSASEKRNEASVKSRLKKIDKSNEYQFVLEGGNAERGSKIFYEKTEVYCTRCHLIDDWGGAVGPELSEIGKQKDRKYLLQSIIEPNAVIAEGFSQIIVLTDEGDTFTGIKKEEDDSVLTLMDKDGKLIRVEKDIIEGQKEGKSSMPEDLIKHLSKSELRDLVEFLASRKERKVSKKAVDPNSEHK